MESTGRLEGAVVGTQSATRDMTTLAMIASLITKKNAKCLCCVSGVGYQRPMATLVSDCRRCGANSMTFDILSDVYVSTSAGWQHFHEVTALCRRCFRPSLMLIKLIDSRMKEGFGRSGTVKALPADAGSVFAFVKVISIADLAAKVSPEHLPEDIAKAFNEGTRCLAIGCHNAAAAMFRLCLDLATKCLLPEQVSDGGPNSYQRRNLAPRLEWLFGAGLLPKGLQDLSTAVRDYGNDGAHDGNLDENEADDLYDFAFALLEELYTRPKRIAQAAARRNERRRGAKPAAAQQ